MVANQKPPRGWLFSSGAILDRQNEMKTQTNKHEQSKFLDAAKDLSVRRITPTARGPEHLSRNRRHHPLHPPQTLPNLCSARDPTMADTTNIPSGHSHDGKGERVGEWGKRESRGKGEGSLSTSLSLYP
jgi:hypothetical protein